MCVATGFGQGYELKLGQRNGFGRIRVEWNPMGPELAGLAETIQSDQVVRQGCEGKLDGNFRQAAALKLAQSAVFFQGPEYWFDQSLARWYCFRPAGLRSLWRMASSLGSRAGRSSSAQRFPLISRPNCSRECRPRCRAFPSLAGLPDSKKRRRRARGRAVARILRRRHRPAAAAHDCRF